MQSIKINTGKCCVPSTPFYSTIPIIIENDTIVKNVSYSTCREQIMMFFGQYVGIASKLNSKNPCAHTPMPDLRKARFLIFGSIFKQKEINNTLAIINSLEKEVGITERTTAKLVVRENDIKELPAGVLFEGSIRWFRSTQTMSLYFLILRFCMRDHARIEEKNIKTYEELIKYATAAASLHLVPGMSYGGSLLEEDKTYIKETGPYWVVLMKNINMIFPVRHWATRFNSARITTNKNPAKYEGIFRLIAGTSKHKDAEKFKPFFAAVKKENNK